VLAVLLMAVGRRHWHNRAVNADPYDGYIELTQEMLESAEPEAQFARDTVDMRDIAEAAVAGVESQLLRLAGNTWNVREGLEKRIGTQEEMAFRALDSMIGYLFATGKLLEKDGQTRDLRPPDPIPYVTSALRVRASSVAHEIGAMLRAGFPIGAHARWRTLYEIDVVAHVLLKGNRGTAARFVNHRWIQYARDVRQSPGELRSPDLEVEANVKKFTRRYGTSFGGTYGWAAEISNRKLGVKSPAMKHLEQLADLDGHSSRVYAAHHGIHADSLGLLHMVDDSGLFHSGARLKGVAAGCLQTVRVLGEINDAVLGIWNRNAQWPKVTLMRYLNDELSLVLQEDINSHMYGGYYRAAEDSGD
jgi:hypothetical protein